MLIDKSTLLLFFIAFTLILVLPTGMFVYVVYLFRNRKNYEYSKENLRLLEWRKAMINEHERYLNELSTQLHHKVLQPAVHLKHTLALMPGKSVDADTLEQNLDMAAQLISEIGHINTSINLEYLRSQSLASLIKNELKNISSQTPIKCKLDYREEPKLNEETKIILFRIAQQAIANILQHAMATAVVVSFLRNDYSFIMCIEDNGVGLNDEKIYGTRTHGIANMRSRAEIINATFAISSQESGGTKITLEMKDLQ